MVFEGLFQPKPFQHSFQDSGAEHPAPILSHVTLNPNPSPTTTAAATKKSPHSTPLPLAAAHRREW